MEKRTDAQIYQIGYKPVPYGYWDNALYTPLQVGNQERFTEVRDTDGTSIAEWNGLYAENTGLYWIWKNALEGKKYVGVCQYRRRLKFEENEDFDKWFSSCDVIVASPVYFPLGSVRKQYGIFHSESDMDLVEKIIKEYYPGYVDDFDKWISKGRFSFYSNGFVMKVRNFRRYCKWLFDILQLFRQEKGWFSPKMAADKISKEIASGERANINGHIGEEMAGEQYQSFVFGFLSERLFTLWVLHNFKPSRIKCIDYTLMEKTENEQ